MLVRLILILILALPLIEIGLFIVIGQAIGLWPTLLGIVLTGIGGALVLRWQGMGVLRQMQLRFSRGEMPARQMGDAVLIGLAGVLLHLAESHSHEHQHEMTEHEHAHRHDDGHHDHVHDPMPIGAHSHQHRHDSRRHAHPHVPDAHHSHRH